MSHEEGALVGAIYAAVAVLVHPNATAKDRHKARELAQEALMKLADAPNK